jgi:hypothetical protein
MHAQFGRAAALLLALHVLCTFERLAKDEFSIKFMLLRASVHNLAKVEVASSSLVSRSKNPSIVNDLRGF